jgi:adenine-specific DNA-methyltransferase
MFGTIDVVACNPPYRKMTATELAPLRTLYQDVFEAQPNLYGLFIGLSVKLLKEGGCAALVTPTSFLSGQYFSKLRTFLMQNAVIEHIGMVSDRLDVFIDVEQETALTVLKRRAIPHAGVTTAKVSVVRAPFSRQ